MARAGGRCAAARHTRRSGGRIHAARRPRGSSHGTPRPYARRDADPPALPPRGNMVKRAEPSRDEVFAILDEVKDPEVPALSVVELGIVRDATVEHETVVVTITPTYSGCPAMREIETDIR